VVKSVQEEVKLKLLESIKLNKDKDNVNVNKNEVNKVKEQAEELDSNKLIENNDVILCNGKSKTLVLDKNNCNSNIIDVKNNKIKVDIKDDKNLEPNVKVLPGLTKNFLHEEAEKRLQSEKQLQKDLQKDCKAKDKVDNSKPSRKEERKEGSSSFLGVILRKILTRLSSLDSGGVFQQPVDLVSVPDYLEVINKPMDLSTMSKKVATGQYESIGDFELDFHLMVNNCLAYNRKSTKYYRAAKTMQRVGRSVFMKAKTGHVNVPEKSTSVTLPKISTNGNKIKVKKNTSSSNRVKEIEKGDSNRTKKGRTKNARVKDPKISEKCSEIVQDCNSSKLEEDVSVGSCTASEAAPSDSGVSTTAPDSDTSASSEFALPTSVPRRKGPKKPLLKQPMQTELTGRRQSERRFGGEKPFGCNHCLLTFSNHLSKVAHERTHMEKPLECPFCEMRFMGDLGLQRHSKIHARQLLESGGNPGKG